MTAQQGSLVIIKMGDGATPTENFLTVAGIRENGFRLNNRLIEKSHLAGGKWRELSSHVGISDISIEGEGVFLNSTVENSLRQKAFNGESNNYELSFGNGDRLTGEFLISQYEREGTMEGEEIYRLRLDSAGSINFVAGGI